MDKIYLILKMSLTYAVTKNPIEDISEPKSEIVTENEYKSYTQEEIDEIINK